MGTSFGGQSMMNGADQMQMGVSPASTTFSNAASNGYKHANPYGSFNAAPQTSSFSGGSGNGSVFVPNTNLIGTVKASNVSDFATRAKPGDFAPTLGTSGKVRAVTEISPTKLTAKINSIIEDVKAKNKGQEKSKVTEEQELSATATTTTSSKGKGSPTDNSASEEEPGASLSVLGQETDEGATSTTTIICPDSLLGSETSNSGTSKTTGPTSITELGGTSTTSMVGDASSLLVNSLSLEATASTMAPKLSTSEEQCTAGQSSNVQDDIKDSSTPCSSVAAAVIRVGADVENKNNKEQQDGATLMGESMSTIAMLNKVGKEGASTTADQKSSPSTEA
eukprot:GSA25T00009555001.1